MKRVGTPNRERSERMRAVHGELLDLGVRVSEATVSSYMPRWRKPPFQTWRSFLDNRVDTLVSVDLFTVLTVFFNVLHVFVVLIVAVKDSTDSCYYP